MFYRESWVEVDLDQIKENIRWLRRQTDRQFIAVIKANGYGAGDGPVARAALEAGAAMLAVSSLDEALSLRYQGITAPVLILGVVDPSQAELLLRYDLAVPAVSLDWVKELVQIPVRGLRVHLKVDTGMHRIGTGNLDELQAMLTLLQENGALVEGIFTHFACSG